MTGWTWEYIDESMDIPRLQAINSHWLDSPPVHVMLARFLGYEKKPPPQAESDPDDELAQLMGMLTNVG